MKKISVVFGTRPEAVKLAPVIVALRKDPRFDVNVCVTAQHRTLLDQVLTIFEIKPDVDLDLMRPAQSLAEITSKVVIGLDKYLSQVQPDLVIVQGDTTTVFAASLAAYYRKISVAHVEAGLRTWDKYSPFPEEVNRILTARIADLHFAPTDLSKRNLMKEGVAEEGIYITGNPVIDALYMARERIGLRPPQIAELPKEVADGTRPLVLITGHRRESFGAGFESICRAIGEIALRFRDFSFVYPVHLNPNVRGPVFATLSDSKNIHLIEPLDYLSFTYLMMQSTLILTDSGGVQEEAPSLGKPVLVMRENTERPEAVNAGTVKIVGTNKATIVKEVTRLLTNKTAYLSMANAANPYGDGKAAGRIVGSTSFYLGLSKERPKDFVPPKAKKTDKSSPFESRHAH